MIGLCGVTEKVPRFCIETFVSFPEQPIKEVAHLFPAIFTIHISLKGS